MLDRRDAAADCESVSRMKQQGQSGPDRSLGNREGTAATTVEALRSEPYCHDGPDRNATTVSTVPIDLVVRDHALQDQAVNTNTTAGLRPDGDGDVPLDGNGTAEREGDPSPDSQPRGPIYGQSQPLVYPSPQDSLGSTWDQADESGPDSSQTRSMEWLNLLYLLNPMAWEGRRKLFHA